MEAVATTARAEALPRLAPGALDRLRTRLRGEILQPSDPDYDAVRKLWNGMVEKRPAAIIRCAGTADVVAALEVARGSGLSLAVRGGGHSICGKSTCDDGLMIELPLMKAIQVDHERDRKSGV